MGSQWASRLATLCIELGSDPDVVVGGELAFGAAGVHNATRLDDHDLAFVFSDRLVFDTFRDDAHLPRAELNRVVLEFDLHAALDDEKGLVGIGVMMPDEFTLDLDQFELVVVHLGDNFG